MLCTTSKETLVSSVNRQGTHSSFISLFSLCVMTHLLLSKISPSMACFMGRGTNIGHILLLPPCLEYVRIQSIALFFWMHKDALSHFDVHQEWKFDHKAIKV